jgi:hypothetical protein
VEDEIDLPPGRMAWVRRGVAKIGIVQVSCSEKKVEFSAAPEGIKISCNDNFFIRFFDESMELFELILAVPIFQRKVDNKKSDRFYIGLDDKLFHPFFKVMKMKVFNRLLGQDGIALLFEHRDFSGKGVVFVFWLDYKVVPKSIGYSLRLTEVSGSIGACVHFNQGNDIRVHRSYEI